MNDPARALRESRTDLARIGKVVDHLLKEIIETRVGSDARRRLVQQLVRIERHQIELKRERMSAFRRLTSDFHSALGGVSDVDLDELPDIALDQIDVRSHGPRLDTSLDIELRRLTDSAGMRPVAPKKLS